MTSRNRARARQRFVDDQAEAATIDVERRVKRAAEHSGRPFTMLDDEAPMAADPLAFWFVRQYVSAISRTHATCDHLSADAPQPQRWDSALPGLLVCLARCSGPGLDLQLRAQGHLPARCGHCGLAPATLFVRVALAETVIIGRVCPACMALHSPTGGDAA